MIGYIVQRLIQGIPVLFLISALVFIVTYLIPGDPASVILGQGASEEAVAAVRERLNLNDSLPVRYVTWLGEVLQGNLGTSIISRQPVTTLIGRALPITLYLSVLSLIIAVIVSVPLGTIAALKRN